MKTVENFQLSLEDAEKAIAGADRMIYMIYPIIKENKLLIKILEEIYNSMVAVVKAILQYEYFYKRIRMYTDAETNFEIFTGCIDRYGIPSEYITTIKKVFLLFRRHKCSPMEFARKEKFVIMSDSLRTDSITLADLRYYLSVAKDILHKAKTILMQRAF